jgi:hypothetical protein
VDGRRGLVRMRLITFDSKFLWNYCQDNPFVPDTPPGLQKDRSNIKSHEVSLILLSNPYHHYSKLKLPLPNPSHALTIQPTTNPIQSNPSLQPPQPKDSAPPAQEQYNCSSYYRYQSKPPDQSSYKTPSRPPRWEPSTHSH